MSRIVKYDGKEYVILLHRDGKISKPFIITQTKTHQTILQLLKDTDFSGYCVEGEEISFDIVAVEKDIYSHDTGRKLLEGDLNGYIVCFSVNYVLTETEDPAPVYNSNGSEIGNIAISLFPCYKRFIYSHPHITLSIPFPFG